MGEGAVEEACRAERNDVGPEPRTQTQARRYGNEWKVYSMKGKLPKRNDPHKPDRYQVMQAEIAEARADASRKALEVAELERIRER